MARGPERRVYRGGHGEARSQRPFGGRCVVEPVNTSTALTRLRAQVTENWPAEGDRAACVAEVAALDPEGAALLEAAFSEQLLEREELD